MTNEQSDLFGSSSRREAMPDGFSYQRDLISQDVERVLIAELGGLPFKDFEFRGYRGKRRVVSFGWRYDFNSSKLDRVDDIPAFLLPVREAAARFAGLSPSQLRHVLVTEYGPGAPIGWHKDRAVFGDVVGVSLLSSCLFRFRRKTGAKWERRSFTAEPRSAYLLRGASRTEWEHSIPPVESLRYSITFRNLKEEIG